jgi:ActR/RegA family two-component response regulator
VHVIRVIVVGLASVAVHVVHVGIGAAQYVADAGAVDVLRGLVEVRLQPELHLSHGWCGWHGRQVSSEPVEHAVHWHRRATGQGCIPIICIQL